MRLSTFFLALLIIFSPLLDPVYGEKKKEKKPSPTNPTKIRVVTKPFAPFAMKKGDIWEGFSIDLLNLLAAEAHFEVELTSVETLTELLDQVKEGKVDMAIAAISMTRQREDVLDFSYPMYDSGFQIMVRANDSNQAGDVFTPIISLLISPEIRYLVLFILIFVFIVANVIWFVEKKSNPHFPNTYFRGIWESIWWSMVTMTSVGYGDKVPQRDWGKLIGIMWMFIGICILSYFTATVTTKLTVDKLQRSISGPEDLPGKRVGTVEKSTADLYLTKVKIPHQTYSVIDKAYEALQQGELDAIVYDSPALLYYSSNEGRGFTEVVGPLFKYEKYAIALPDKSPFRERVNQALLSLQESGAYEDLLKKWFRSKKQ